MRCTRWRSGIRSARRSSPANWRSCSRWRKEEPQLDSLALKGSYAGAMGMGQFMPSSYRNWAKDGDGDGRRDLLDRQAGRVRLDRQLLRRPRLAARRRGGRARGRAPRTPPDFVPPDHSIRSIRSPTSPRAAIARRPGQPRGRGRDAADARWRRRHANTGSATATSTSSPATTIRRCTPWRCTSWRRRSAATARRRDAQLARCASLLPATASLALAGCASGPKKSASEPPHCRMVPPSGVRACRASASRKRSPYAPAQEDVSKRGNYTRGGLYAPQHPGHRARTTCPTSTRSRNPTSSTSRVRATATARRTTCSARTTRCSTAPRATTRPGWRRSTATSSTAAAPPTSRCTTCTPSPPRTRRCRCRASRA